MLSAIGYWPLIPLRRVVNAHHQLQCQRPALGRHQGVLRLVRRRRTPTCCACRKPRRRSTSSPTPAFRPDGYRAFFKDASTKKGYSGVAIYSQARARRGAAPRMGWSAFDDEGRYIEARFGNLSVVSFYIPSGSSGELRQGFKFEVMQWLEPILHQWLAVGPRLRAVRRLEHRAQPARHQELDQQPEELRLPAARARLAQRAVSGPRRVTAAGSMPTATLHAEGQDYTWWSNRGAARANNVGWRIDYQFVTPSLRDRLRACAIHPKPALLRPRAVRRRL